MKQTIPVLLALSLSLSPAFAQEEDGNDSLREGWGLLSEGSRLILEGLSEEMRPLMDEHVLPFMAALMEMIDDVALYEMPERLPNGDIIIRRSEPLEPEEDEAVEDPIDL